MDKVITFTRIFSEYHIRRGETTYFVEQILNNLSNQNINCNVIHVEKQLGHKLLAGFRTKCGSKGHTIRSGYNWSVGDKFSVGIWLDKPHVSEIVIIEPIIEIKKIWTFDCDDNGEIKVDGICIDLKLMEEIAKNDGLSLQDFEEWLIVPCLKAKKPFNGQIICWDAAIKYELHCLNLDDNPY